MSIQSSIPLYPAVYAMRRRLREAGARGALDHFGRRLRAQLYERERHHVVVKELREIVVPLRHGAVRLEPLERRHLPALQVLNRERHDLTGDERFAGDLGSGYAGFVARKG